MNNTSFAYKPFRLTDNFLSKFISKPAPFGFDGLGELTYYRTYSRQKEDGKNEVWWETVKRVVEGTYNMQKRHILANDLEWNEHKAQYSAQEMYERIFDMKFLPPGRGLWAMGSPLTEEKGLQSALFNCAFVSTQNIAKDLEEPFTFLMEASMLGIGVGFDVNGAGSFVVKGFGKQEPEPFVIPDSREGWVESVGRLIRHGFTGGCDCVFDYSQIRPEGTPIKGFGGYASGPAPLQRLHELIRVGIQKNTGTPITVRTIVDLQNHIGVCVVAGNVRRSAEISFGRHDDAEYLNLKNYRWNSETMQYEGVSADRADFGWASNNSVFSDIGMDYTTCGTITAINGEPGYAWLENMREYGRMRETERDGRDHRVAGGNPCLEQSLESYECCNLVETFPHRHENLEDYTRTLKFAYLYAKTVTLGKTPWKKSNAIMLRNRRIGCSQSGIQQFIAANGLGEYVKWCQTGYIALQKYDRIYSEWLCIPQSIKMTSVKPSGTVSLLAGATPGMHWPEDLHYIRRMRLSATSDLVSKLRKAGYPIEPCVGQEETTVVVSIPVSLAKDKGQSKLRPVGQVSMWEQLAMAALIQREWADNQVSSTVTFDPVTEGPQIPHALDYYQYQLKGISLLPRLAKGAYAQMPYESITKETYDELKKNLKPLRLKNVEGEQVEHEPGCEAGVCLIGGPAQS